MHAASTDSMGSVAIMDMTPVPVPAAASGQGVFDSTTPETDRLKRKRQPRNSACQSCSALKMKCVPSSAAGFCERCNRMGKECLAAVPKPRKRRSTNGHLEEHSQSVPVSGLLDGYVSPDRDPPMRPMLPPPSTFTEHEAPKPAVITRSPPFHTDNESFRLRFAQSLRIDTGLSADNGVLYGVDAGFVHHSFEIFRNLAANFPFIDVHLNFHPHQMVIDRPMITLAVCVITSATNTQMQRQLSRTFRQAVAAKAIVEGESDLDLLTGLLIYLAWHHQHMSNSRVYQHLHTLAGIAREHSRHDMAHDKSRQSLEAQRVLLGCYYLCYNVSKLGYNRPNPLPWSTRFGNYATNLSAAGAIHSDRIVQPLLELTQCLEDLDIAIDNSTATLDSAALPLTMDLHAKSTSRHLQNLRTQYSSLNSHPAFATTYLLIQARTLLTPSDLHSGSLANTLATTKSYLENLLAAPPTTLHQLPVVEWSTLLSILAFLPRLTSTQSQGPNSPPHSSIFRPEALLDALVSRMSSAPSNDPLAPRQENLLAQLRGICDALKRKLAQDRELASPEGEGRFRPVNQYGAESQARHERSRSGSGRHGSGQTDLDFGEVRNGVLEDEFWEALFQAKR